MRRDTVRVMGIDPGSVHVGFSIGSGDINLMHGEKSPRDFLQMLPESKVRRVAIERFDIRQFTNDSLETVKLIGAIEHICYSRDIRIGYVNASSKKKFIDILDSWLTGHARDAEAIRLYDYYYSVW